MTYRCPRCCTESERAGNCAVCAPRFFVSVRQIPEPVKAPAFVPVPARPCACLGWVDASGEYQHDPTCPTVTRDLPRPETIVSIATRPVRPSHERFNCLGRAFALAMLAYGPMAKARRTLETVR